MHDEVSLEAEILLLREEIRKTFKADADRILQEAKEVGEKAEQDYLRRHGLQ